MKLEWFISLRYLKAKSQQRFVSFISFMSIVGVALGVGVLIATLAILTGFAGEIQSKIAGTNAHILVSRAAAFSDWQAVAKGLEGTPGIAGMAPVIEGHVMVSSDFGAAWGLVKGVDPKLETTVTDLASYMERAKIGKGTPDLLEHPERVAATALKGAPEPAYLPGIILGSGMAQRLLVFPGDLINVISPEGGMGNMTGVSATAQRFKVVGTFESGMYQVDQNIAYANLKDAQLFYDMEGFVSQLQIRVEDVGAVDQVEAHIRDRLLTLKDPTTFQVTSLREKYRNLFWALKLEKVVTALLLFFIVMVAAFNILTSLTMVVMEKGKEIAILKAMGLSSRGVMRIFVYQGLMIGVIGAILGNALGLGFGWALQHYEFVKLPKDVYYITTIPVDIRWNDLLVVNLISVGLCLLATLAPARAAASKDPVEILRYE